MGSVTLGDWPVHNGNKMCVTVQPKTAENWPHISFEWVSVFSTPRLDAGALHYHMLHAYNKHLSTQATTHLATRPR